MSSTFASRRPVGGLVAQLDSFIDELSLQLPEDGLCVGEADISVAVVQDQQFPDREQRMRLGS
ncbi:MAG: hypothetical protein HC888_04515 [Candidatus Competibacteraceae bacterium]|nr:hypothetical protein [Candidatus Competibacteraceae bacterium]